MENKCNTCEHRRDIYCQHPKAKKFMYAGYLKTPIDCPKEAPHENYDHVIAMSLRNVG